MNTQNQKPQDKDRQQSGGQGNQQSGGNQQDKDRQQNPTSGHQQQDDKNQRQDDKNQRQKNSFNEGQSDNSRDTKNQATDTLEDEEDVEERSGQSYGDKRDPEIDMPAENPEKTEKKIPNMKDSL
jgi:Ca-activated chloride channel family protein